MDKELGLKEMMMEAACTKFAYTLIPNLGFMVFMTWIFSLVALIGAIIGGNGSTSGFSFYKLWSNGVPCIVVVVNIISVIKIFIFANVKKPKLIKGILFTNYFDEAVGVVGIVYCVWFVVELLRRSAFHWGFLFVFLFFGLIAGCLLASFVKSMKWNNKIIKACASFGEKEGENVGNFKEI